MPRIEIGAGIVLAVAAAFGVFGSIPVAALLLAFGLILILYGSYEEFVKPRFRVDKRLNDWLQRRGWSVRIERVPQFNFALHITAPGSEKQIVITRDRRAQNDVLAFTAKVGLHPAWLAPLVRMSNRARVSLQSDIRIYLTSKNLGVSFVQLPDGSISWPPSVLIQTALPQDSSLSQHSVDMAAKSLELSMIGVRDVIRKSLLLSVPELAEQPEVVPEMDIPE